MRPKSFRSHGSPGHLGGRGRAIRMSVQCQCRVTCPEPKERFREVLEERFLSRLTAMERRQNSDAAWEVLQERFLSGCYFAAQVDCCLKPSIRQTLRARMFSADKAATSTMPFPAPRLSLEIRRSIGAPRSAAHRESWRAGTGAPA